MVYFPAAVFGRPTKLISMDLRNILAISTEEPTTTGKDPNCSCIMGPYLRESSWMDR